MVVRTALVSLHIANPLVAWLVYRGEVVAGTQAHEQALGFWLLRALSQESSTLRNASKNPDRHEIAEPVTV